MPIQRRPILVMLAGPNGAGKSTMTPLVQLGPKIDPDFVAKQLNPSNPEAVALQAGKQVILEMKALVAQGRSFTYETTLSSNHSLQTLRDARAAGYETRLYFVLERRHQGDCECWSSQRTTCRDTAW